MDDLELYRWYELRLNDSAIVDSQETIVTTDFQGNEGGCSSFAGKLRS